VPYKATDTAAWTGGHLVVDLQGFGRVLGPERGPVLPPGKAHFDLAPVVVLPWQEREVQASHITGGVIHYWATKPQNNRWNRSPAWNDRYTIQGHGARLLKLIHEWLSL
jgi:hypothetical protein